MNGYGKHGVLEEVGSRSLSLGTAREILWTFEWETRIWMSDSQEGA